MQRTAHGPFQRDLGAVGLPRQFDGPDQRRTRDRQSDQRAPRQRLDDARQSRAEIRDLRLRRRQQPINHESGEHQTEQPGDLVAPEHHEGREHPRDPAPEGRAVERPVQRPERQREPRKTQDLPGVLDTPRRRAAISERQSRHQPAGGAKTAIAEVQHPAETAERQHQKDDAIGLLKVRLRI